MQHATEKLFWRRQQMNVILVSIAILLLGTLFVLWMPHVSTMSVRIEGGPAWITDTLPITIAGKDVEKNRNITITIPYTYRGFQITSFILKGRGCIQNFSVNGTPMLLEFCELERETLLHLQGVVKPGKNLLSVTLQRTGEDVHFDMIPSLQGLLGKLLLSGYVLILLTLFIIIFRRSFEQTTTVMLLAVVAAGLRIYYVIRTPFYVRTYDDFGHIPYIFHFLQSWSLPTSTAGWETHQPPLYYVISSMIVRLSDWFLMTTSLRSIVLQHFSLLLSLLALGIVFMIGATLYGKKGKPIGNTYYVLLTGTMTGFILFSSRITNDLPSLIAALFGLYYSIRLWETNKIRYWYFGILAFSIGFLAKLNAITGAPALGLVLLLLPAFSLRKKIAHGMTGLLLALALTAWLPILRFQESPKDVQRYVNIGTIGLDPALKISYRSPLQIVTLNPVAMLRMPFNNNRIDESRRANFPEYFLRSAFFGEFRSFNAQTLAPGILAAAILLLPWMAWGAIDTLRRSWREELPLLVTTATVMASALFYPIVWQFSCNQDFRFSMVLVVPIAYFIVRGVRKSPFFLRIAGMTCIAIFGLLNSIFIALQ